MLQENKAKRSVAQIIGMVVIFVLTVLIILTFVLFGIFKGSNSAPKLFGYRVYVITSDRMEPRIPKGSAVFVEEGVLPQPDSQNAILCRIDGSLYVIGCVGTETSETGEVSYIVKYDNADDGRTWGIPEADIVGVAQKYDTFFGGLIRFTSSKSGMLAIVIIPCLLIIAYEVVMLLIYRKRAAEIGQGKPLSEGDGDDKPLISKVLCELDPEDLPPEREDIHIPVDILSEEKFVEEQLEHTDDKLNDAVAETADKDEPEEIELDVIDVEPEETVLKAESTVTAEAELERVASVKENSSGGSISDSRIDELLKLLEQEKKRLEGK